MTIRARRLVMARDEKEGCAAPGRAKGYKSTSVSPSLSRTANIPVVLSVKSQHERALKYK